MSNSVIAEVMAADANVGQVVRHLALVSSTMPAGVAFNGGAQMVQIKPSAGPVPTPTDIELLSEPSRRAKAILAAHFVKSKSDPEYIAADLDAMGEYIARRPEAFAVLEQLALVNWTMHFQPGEFRTELKGTAISVDSAKVYFDSRKAAVLIEKHQCREFPGSCVASPVDALLHELLHVQLVLSDAKSFIKSGGMTSTLYPYDHERKVIAMENDLYRLMSYRDSHRRPLRVVHSGRLTTAACVTCLAN